MKRILVLGAAAVVAIVVVGGLLLYSSLDSIVKAAIEKIGSQVTGTRVEVDDVKIVPSSGEGSLRGFRVTNPAGFERDHAFQFDEITMKIDLTTLAQDPVVIDEVVVQGPRIRYELGGKGTNVGTIQKNVESYSGGSSGGRNLVIRNLYFRDGTVRVAGRGKLLGKGLTTPLPDLHMTDIGSEDGGASPDVVVKKVVAELGRKVATAVGSLNLDEVGDSIETGAGHAKEAAKTAGEKLKGLLKKDD